MAELLGKGFESLPPDDDFTLLLFFGFVCISPGGPDLPHSTFSHTSSVPLASSFPRRDVSSRIERTVLIHNRSEVVQKLAE